MRIQLNWFNEKLAARLADLAAGRLTPATPRDAATVMVLRSTEQPPQAPGPDLQVLMLRRTAAMKFAPGAYVFPGGSVDPADYGAEIGWQGPSAAEFGARLGASAEVARALVCAAVRETFEESGVLLAGPPGDGPLATPSGPSWEADRMAMTAGTLTLAALLSGRGLVLRADRLVPWARWITPDGEPGSAITQVFGPSSVIGDGFGASTHQARSVPMPLTALWSAAGLISFNRGTPLRPG